MAAHIAHTGAQTAHHLEHGIAYRALVRYTTLYALRHELLGAVLEVTVGRALVHGAQRAHAAVHLKLTTLVNLRLTGRLLTAGHQRADHHHGTAGRNGLYDFAAVLNTTVCNDRDTVLVGHLCCVINRCDLGHTDTGNHTGGADRAGADTHLYRICTGLDQSLGALCGGHITGNQRDLRERIFHLLHCL